MSKEYKGMYKSSFGGADITAVIGTATVGTLQAISYSITREKGPVYTMGSADPRSFARGKRAIAGSLVFFTIDRQSFINHIKEHASTSATFFASKADIKYDYNGKEDVLQLFGDNAESSVGTFANKADRYQNVAANSKSDFMKQSATVWYADQVLPFDVNISAANEVGGVMKKSFVGVEILNEGGGVSIDDLALEEQYTYVCRGITPWTNVQ